MIKKPLGGQCRHVQQSMNNIISVDNISMSPRFTFFERVVFILIHTVFRICIKLFMNTHLLYVRNSVHFSFLFVICISTIYWRLPIIIFVYWHWFHDQIYPTTMAELRDGFCYYIRAIMFCQVMHGNKQTH